MSYWAWSTQKPEKHFQLLLLFWVVQENQIIVGHRQRKQGLSWKLPPSLPAFIVPGAMTQATGGEKSSVALPSVRTCMLQHQPSRQGLSITEIVVCLL